MELNRKCDSPIVTSIKGSLNLCVILVKLYDIELSENQRDLAVPKGKALYH